MKSRGPSIIFPELSHTPTENVVVSRQEFHSLCDMQPLTQLVGSIANYAVQKNKTRESQKQYAAMSAAVDAEYTELEKQALIRYQENIKRLEEEFRLKAAELDSLFQKAEAEADLMMIEHKVSFDRYVKTSDLCRKIFDNLNQHVKYIDNIIKLSDEHEIANNTKYYFKLNEHRRRLLRGIAKYSELIS